jgi:hypothetical protein
MAITPFEAAKLLAEFKINLNAADFARELDKLASRYKAAEGARPAPPPPKPAPKAQPKPRNTPEIEEFAQLYDAMTHFQRRLKSMSPGLKRKLDDEAESGGGWTKELSSYIEQAHLLMSQINLEEEDVPEPEPPPPPPPPKAPEPKRESRAVVEQEIVKWLMGVWQSGTGHKPTVTFSAGSWKSPFYSFAVQCYRHMGISSEGLGNLIKRMI